jgi:hypothetical protein
MWKQAVTGDSLMVQASTTILLPLILLPAPAVQLMSRRTDAGMISRTELDTFPPFIPSTGGVDGFADMIPDRNM